MSVFYERFGGFDAAGPREGVAPREAVAPSQGIADGTTRAVFRGRPRAEIVDPETFLGHAAAWRDLAEACAEPNAFLEPAILAAAQRAAPAVPILVLLSWEDSPAGPRLLGAWAFARQGGWPGRLLAPAVPHASLASPVVRPGRAEAVIEGWLDLLARTRGLPRLLELRPVLVGPGWACVERAMARRGSPHHVVARNRRAVLRSALDGEAYLEQSVSGSRRRKLRQLRAKLGRQGEVGYARHRGAAAGAAVERFVALEALGWKGRRGTALEADPALTAFMVAAVRDLAADDRASVTELTLDGRPISMGIVLHSGRGAFFWKIAYDEDFGGYSPGYLLALDDTAALLADGGLDFTDSCADAEVGIMSEVWAERLDVADVLVGVRAGGRLGFRAAKTAYSARTLLPELRRRLRLRKRAAALRNRLARVLPTWVPGR